jgi:hypothetical protein
MLNRKKARQEILKLAQAARPGADFSAVSEETYEFLEAHLRNLIIRKLQSHPHKKTITLNHD